MMNIKELNTRKQQSGQATLEFIYTFWILFALFLLMLAVAVIWHAHHITSPISLEAASRESVQPGWGQSYVIEEGNSWDSNTTLNVSIADFPFDTGAGHGLEVRMITVEGIVAIPWVPFDLQYNVPVQGTTTYPVWEFNGGGN
jgi:hypothetical protein